MNKLLISTLASILFLGAAQATELNAMQDGFKVERMPFQTAIHRSGLAEIYPTLDAEQMAKVDWFIESEIELAYQNEKSREQEIGASIARCKKDLAWIWEINPEEILLEPLSKTVTDMLQQFIKQSDTKEGSSKGENEE